MRKAIAVSMLVLAMSCSTAMAAITIDGDISDWATTPGVFTRTLPANSAGDNSLDFVGMGAKVEDGYLKGYMLLNSSGNTWDIYNYTDEWSALTAGQVVSFPGVVIDWDNDVSTTTFAAADVLDLTGASWNPTTYGLIGPEMNIENGFTKLSRNSGNEVEEPGGWCNWDNGVDIGAFYDAPTNELESANPLTDAPPSGGFQDNWNEGGVYGDDGYVARNGHVLEYCVKLSVFQANLAATGSTATMGTFITLAYQGQSSPANIIAGRGMVTATASGKDFTTVETIRAKYAEADVNQDGVVNGADFLAWNAGYGTTPAKQSDGDLNGDGVVNGADFLVWNNGYGAAAPTPEPATMILLALGGVAAIRRRK